MRRPTTDIGWIRRWKKTIELIRDKATDLRDDRDMYGTYLKTISENPALDKRNEFFFLLERMYVDHMLVALRTFDDTDLRSYSLYNLIEEILDHPRVITREWFVRRYGKKRARFGERHLSKHWGNGPYLSEGRLRGDLRAVKTACKKIRTVVNCSGSA